MPDEARAAAMKEVGRLNQMPSMAPEVGIIRTYLDWILDLPWATMTEDNLDVNHAAKILEQYHFGLKDAKDRILEYIAVRSLKPKAHAPADPVLCRPARHRKNLAGTVDRRGAGTQVCARVAGRRAGRG